MFQRFARVLFAAGLLWPGMFAGPASSAELAWSKSIPRHWRATLAKAHNRDFVAALDRNIDFNAAPFSVAEIDLGSSSALLLRWENSLYCGSGGCSIELWMPGPDGEHREVLGAMGDEITIGDKSHLGMPYLWIDDMRFRWNGERYSSGAETADAENIQGSAGPAKAVVQPIVPVMVGGEPDLDARGSAGVVKGLKRGGDGFLSLRAGPDKSFPEIGRLKNGDELILCDYKAPWHGVVLPELGLCDELSSPVLQRQPYGGRCKAGWVHESFLEVTAG